MAIDNIGVHASHCCVVHGCKYGEDDTCPVVNKEIQQKYPCESCGHDDISPKNLKDMFCAKFCIGDKVVHYRYGKGIILGNYHKRGNNYYWHIAYANNTFGYNTESALRKVT